jgi:GPH family glycoside/pentoside/hexuronide:cation symporter
MVLARDPRIKKSSTSSVDDDRGGIPAAAGPVYAVAHMDAPLKLTLPRQLAYACGQAGNVLSESLIVTYLLLLYLPPATKAGETTTALVPTLFLGLVPAIFLANVIPRGIDTFLDPLVANLSDRSGHRFGRRRIFMAIGIVPLCLSTAAVFFPPWGPESNANVLFMTAMLTVYFASFSLYVAPYLALLPELAPDQKLNVRVSTMLAAFALVGGLMALNGGQILWSALAPESASFADRQAALQTTMVILTVVAFLLLLVPILGVPEPRLVAPRTGEPSHAPLIASLKKTFSDGAFIPYVIGTTLFAFGFNIVRTATLFFITVLMAQPKDSPATIAVFGVAALAFPVVAALATRLGKRRVMIAGTLVLAFALCGFWFVDDLVSGLVFLSLSGIGVSTFLALPNAMLSDICNAATKRTGEQREAMFFGAQGFLQKINLGISTGIFGLLLSFGNSVDDPMGIRLAGPVAAVALVGAAIAYWRYPEQRIQAELADR